MLYEYAQKIFSKKFQKWGKCQKKLTKYYMK